MKSFLKHNREVLFIYFGLLALAAPFLILFDKVPIHIKMNTLVGNKLLDSFFYYITYLGDGVLAAFLLLAILISNVRDGIYATVSFLSATLSSIVLKVVFYDDVNRPYYVFNYFNDYPLKYVEGLKLHIHNSFPSGHATQAFAIFMCLVFTSKNKSLSYVFFAVALLTAFSRVYLSQHWLIDIMAGSFIGLFFSMIFYFVLVQKNLWASLNRSIFNLKKN